MANEGDSDLLKQIHKTVTDTSIKVSAIDERTKIHTGQILRLEGDVGELRGSFSKLNERTRSHGKDIDELEKDVKKSGGVAGLAAGGGASGLFWLLSKLFGWGP